MNALLLAAAAASGAANSPDPTDLGCYRLMAELARADDPAGRALGIAAGSYFVGRIDAAAPGYDLAAAPAPGAAERPALIRRCGERLQANGFDARSLGRSLAPAEPTA